MIGNSKVYVAGHNGMVGSAIVRALSSDRKVQIVTRNRNELDLTNQSAVDGFFKNEKPDEVYLAAAKVGGIYANSNYPAEFIYQNLMIETNVINAAAEEGVKKILFLGSSCIYPKNSGQPIKEESLMTGVLESTNEPYAIAKIAGIKLCEAYNRQYGRERGLDYRCVMPTNLYGPGDNYHDKNSHVIPALIRRFHEAKEKQTPQIEIWGTGEPFREFLHVDDMASACIHVMNTPKEKFDKVRECCDHLNIGSGDEISIGELANKIANIIGYQGNIVFDSNKPDGMKRKVIDSSRLRSLGWTDSISLDAGLRAVYEDYVKNFHSIREY